MIFNRKKTIFALVLMLILCLVLMYKDNKYTEVKLQESVKTNGTPVSEHTVILDAGHGYPDGRCYF